ncbi:MAG: pilin, partial [Candidatus Liptonbacteria bacterium]|nr:pilin [Candidatus Liptonbacteria bacterium]
MIYKKIKYAFLAFLAVFFLFLPVFSASAAPSTMLDVNVALPGPYDLSTTGPVGAIGNIYYFAIGLGGLLAFIAITYAGIKWMLARGNPSGISDAKDQIVQALLGLVLLFGAYIILNTINPALTVLSIPGLTELAAPSSTANLLPPAPEYSCFSGSAGGDTCYEDSSCNGECASGETCQPDSECTATVTFLGNCDPANWATLAANNSEPYPRKDAP